MAATPISHNTLTPTLNDNFLTPSLADTSLSNSTHITKQELIRRRFHRLRQLSKIYRHHYWALMEDLRAHYRHYYWTYGLSPFFPTPKPDPDSAGLDGEGCGESNNNNKRCAYVACKLKAMALTSFCHLHILSDPHQKLYKACNYVIKAPQQGQILCGKPILRSAVPSLCNVHLPKAQKDVKHALKKAGLTAASSGRLAQKFHAIVAEYVHFIQSKRRAAQKCCQTGIVIKEEFSS